MMIIAKCPVQLNGHIYRKGEKAEYKGAIDARIAACFAAENGTALRISEVPPQVDTPPPQGDTPPPPQGDTPPPQGDTPPPPQGDTPPPQGDTPPPPQGDTPPPPQGDTLFPDSEPSPDELVKRTIAALRRDGVMRQLDEMGVTYPANAKNDYLARLLLVSKGEIKDM